MQLPAAHSVAIGLPLYTKHRAPCIVVWNRYLSSILLRLRSPSIPRMTKSNKIPFTKRDLMTPDYMMCLTVSYLLLFNTDGLFFSEFCASVAEYPPFGPIHTPLLIPSCSMPTLHILGRMCVVVATELPVVTNNRTNSPQNLWRPPNYVPIIY